eukprot:gene21130-28018_t
MAPVQVVKLKGSEDAVSESGSSTSKLTPAYGGRTGKMKASVEPAAGSTGSTRSTKEYKKKQESYDAEDEESSVSSTTMECLDPTRKNLEHCYAGPSYGSEAVGVPAAENENGISGAKNAAAKQTGLFPPGAAITDALVSPGVADNDAVVPPGAAITDALVSPGAADNDAVVPPGAAITDALVSPGVADNDAVVPPGAAITDAMVPPGVADSDAVVSPRAAVTRAGGRVLHERKVSIQQRYVQIDKPHLKVAPNLHSTRETPATAFSLILGDLLFAPPHALEVVEVLAGEFSHRLRERFISRQIATAAGAPTPLKAAQPLAPVFMPSKGRAGCEVKDCKLLDELNTLVKIDEGLVAVAVVEASDVTAYLNRWPNLTYAVLPEDNRGLAYSRFVIKRMCSGARLISPQGGGPTGGPTDDLGALHIPKIFMVDDNVSFVEYPDLVKGKKVRGGKGVKGENSRGDKRHVPATTALQQLQEDSAGHPAAGVEKDCAKSISWKDCKSDETTFFYKVLLIDLVLTDGVDFLPGLFCAEDIDFLFRVMQQVELRNSEMGKNKKRLLHPYKSYGPYFQNSSYLRKGVPDQPQTSWEGLLLPWRKHKCKQVWEVEALHQLQLWITHLRSQKETPAGSDKKGGFPKSVDTVLLEMEAVVRGFMLPASRFPLSARTAAQLQAAIKCLVTGKDIGLLNLIKQKVRTERGEGACSGSATAGKLCSEVERLRRNKEKDGSQFDGQILWSVLSPVLQKEFTKRDWPKSEDKLRQAFTLPLDELQGSKAVHEVLHCEYVTVFKDLIRILQPQELARKIKEAIERLMIGPLETPQMIGSLRNLTKTMSALQYKVCQRSRPALNYEVCQYNRPALLVAAASSIGQQDVVTPHQQAKAWAEEFVKGPGAVVDAISAAAIECGTSSDNMVSELIWLATLMPDLPEVLNTLKGVDQHLEKVEKMMEDMAWRVVDGRIRQYIGDVNEALLRTSKLYHNVLEEEEEEEETKTLYDQNNLFARESDNAMQDVWISGTYSMGDRVHLVVPDSVSQLCEQAVQRVHRSRSNRRSYMTSHFAQLLGHWYRDRELCGQKIALLIVLYRGERLTPRIIRNPSLLSLDVKTLERYVD